MQRSVRVLAIFLLLWVHKSSAQSFTPKYNTTMAYSTHGYYEYLPQGYVGGTEKYPLILFLHGAGEMGDGSPGQLETVINLGLPRVINLGNFPSSFTVNGQTHKFIVISPQFTNVPNSDDITAILDYLILNYRVNVNRVYLTGFSMGGGVAWDFVSMNGANAGRIAALLPVAGFSYPTVDKANVIAASNLPVWATHNSGDPLIPVQYTNDWIQFINTSPTPPSIAARKTIFNVNGHNAWGQTYNAAFTENGLNVFQWMLQYQRALVALPVHLVSYEVQKASRISALIRWATSEESNNDHFTIERSADGNHFQEIGTVAAAQLPGVYSFTDAQALHGVNYYRLSQTDLNGQRTYYSILKIKFDGADKLDVFPNPVLSTIRIGIDGEERGSVKVSVLTADGRMMKEFHFEKTGYSWSEGLDVSSLPKGNYYIKVQSKERSFSEKIVKL